MPCGAGKDFDLLLLYKDEKDCQKILCGAIGAFSGAKPTGARIRDMASNFLF